MRLRVNPQTGRIAEQVPAEYAATDEAQWFTYGWEEGRGLTVHLLTEQDVAEWPEVVLAPKPPDPEFAFAMACPSCDPHPITTDVHERERWHADHDETHLVSRYVVRLQHPDGHAADLAVGDQVAFFGSGEGDVAGLVHATVTAAAQVLDSDGDPVDGYEVTVDGGRILVPATALARA